MAGMEFALTVRDWRVAEDNEILRHRALDEIVHSHWQAAGGHQPSQWQSVQRTGDSSASASRPVAKLLWPHKQTYILGTMYRGCMTVCNVIRDVALGDKGRLLNDIQMAPLSLSRTQNRKSIGYHKSYVHRHKGK